MPAPTDSAVTDVGAAKILDPRRVVANRLGCREVDLLFGRAQVGLDQVEEPLPHRSLERAGPGDRCCPAVFVRVLVHVERVDVGEGQALGVDRPGRDLVLGHRPDGKDEYELPPVVACAPYSADEVVGERLVEVVALEDLHPEVRVVMPGELGAGNPAHPLARLAIAKRDEARQRVVEV